MLPLERTILRQLFADKTYAEAVVPYLKEEYFHTNEAALVYRLFAQFFEKFHAVPAFAAVKIGLDSVRTIKESEAKAANDVLDEVQKEPELDDTQNTWLLEETEEFCQERAVYVGIQECIKVMDDPKATRHVIPDIMKTALGVSFDQHVGHDYFDCADERYEFYHRPEERIPFDLDVFNMVTKGGVPKKTLNVVLAGTNVGKSLFLVHLAAALLRMNKNVLYITLEMAEEWIAQRIDANMMDIPMDDVVTMPRGDFIRKIQSLRQTSTGRLIIKEYPTASAHAGNFRSLLQDLYLKQNFKPDVIIVDYIGICMSSRLKNGSGESSYTLYKFIAEELRGLAGEFGVPVWTGAQFNRSGFDATNASMKDIGESFGIPMTADFLFALVTTEDLQKVGQMAVQFLKNRYNKKNQFQQHLIGVDTDRMKFYDLSASQIAQSMAVVPSIPPPPQQGNPSAGSFGYAGRRRTSTKAAAPLSSLRAENELPTD